MTVTRRDFLKYCSISAGALGLASSDLTRLGQVLAGTSHPKVLWVHGASCSGCSVSFLNRISSEDPQTAADVLIDWINLVYHPTLMDAAGETAAAQIERAYRQKGYILAVEGGVPTGFDGAACWAYTRHDEEVTFEHMLRRLASRAWAIVSIGTCAAWGGIPAAGENPGAVQGVAEFTGRDVVNIAGCPPHPDWIVWAIAQLCLGNPITVDGHGRPTELFANKVHQGCEHRNAPRATTFGTTGECLRDLGCRGTATYGPCPTGLWNNGVNWCAGAGAQCIGCTEPVFPGPESFYETYGSGGPGDAVAGEEPIQIGEPSGGTLEREPTLPDLGKTVRKIRERFIPEKIRR